MSNGTTDENHPQIWHYGKEAPRAKGRNAESMFQKAVTRLVRFKYSKEAIYYHVPNGGRRNAREAAKLKAEGVRSGVVDCCFDNARKGFHGLKIELKVQGGKLSENQIEYMNAVIYEGYFACVCWNMESVEKILQWYFEK